jgi:formylglycine-generating enzyme required for sulfatase activity
VRFKPNGNGELNSGIPTGNNTLYAKRDHESVNGGGTEYSYEMVFVPGGSFQMGNDRRGWPDNERPGHTVTLSNFYIGRYEVTQALYQSVTGNNPCDYYRGDNRPVISVTWYDAIEFCNKLSEMDGLQPVYTISGRKPVAGYPITSAAVKANWSRNGYRLPTEAEWEYAAKGGDGSPGGNYRYAGGNRGDDVAWYSGNSGLRTHEVGTKAPNDLGIYDMSGNVYEWCWDRYGRYSSATQTNPNGAFFGSHRTYRGGSLIDGEDCYGNHGTRPAYRNYRKPSIRYSNLGFRLVRPWLGNNEE